MSVIRSIRQLEALTDDWNALADRQGSPLLRHEWFLACARTLHREQDLRIVVCRRGERVVAIAPFVASGDRGIERLEFIGASVLHEPCGLLFEDDAALAALVDEIVSFGRPLLLQRLETASLVSKALRAAVRRPGFMVVRKTSPALGVPIRTSWDAFERTLSTRITKNLPRVERRAAREVGPVRAETLVPHVDDVDRLLEVVVRVEGAGWKGREGSALRCRTTLREFFSSYSAAAARDGRLRISQLFLGTHVAAVELAVEAYGRIWQLKIGYDEAFGAFYPGLLLMRQTIRSAFERGLDSYEFLGSEAEWEHRWNPEPREYQVALVYPGTWRGLGIVASDSVKSAGRRLRSRRSGRVQEIRAEGGGRDDAGGA